LPAVRANSATVAAAPAPAPKPEWADLLLRAAGCIGKTKSDVVAELGEPKAAPSLFGTAKEYRYSIGDAPIEGDMFGGGASYVEFLEVKFPDGKTAEAVFRLFKRGNRLPAEDAWKGLGVAGAGPTSIIADESSMRRYWLEPDRFKVQTKPGVYPPGPEVIEFPLMLKGKLEDGKTMLLLAAAPAPHLKAETFFNTNTDRRELGDLAPDLGFDWRSCQVYGIRIVQAYVSEGGETEYALDPD
jgi:hypothetical protein